ncbi:MAG: glutamate racemase [Candidatus Atribacteria bacterium]|nr:glutamate racemase [Candidatus Atribacteria bacterium]
MVFALDQFLPSEEIVYLADPLHFPYGEKTKIELIPIVSSLITFLDESLKAKLIITACGTISSNCLEELSALFQVPIIGIIDPASKEAVKKTRTGKVVVLATSATIRSGTFRKHIQKIDPTIMVKEEAWPEFVDAVEKGLHQTKQWKQWIQNQLIRFKKENFDTIIMGCTHFALISSFFKDIAQTSFEIINPTQSTAQEVKKYLEESDLLNQSKLGSKRIIIRGSNTNIKNTIQNYPDLQKIHLEAFPETNQENTIFYHSQRIYTSASTPR